MRRDSNDPVPPQLRHLAELIGMPTALRLCQARPGLRIYVPRKPRADHELCKLLGRESFQALCESHGGDLLEVPKATRLHAAIRANQVRHSRRNKSERAVALEYGLHPRQVRRICANDAVSVPQTDLFAA